MGKDHYPRIPKPFQLKGREPCSTDNWNYPNGWIPASDRPHSPLDLTEGCQLRFASGLRDLLHYRTPWYFLVSFLGSERPFLDRSAGRQPLSRHPDRLMLLSSQVVEC